MKFITLSAAFLILMFTSCKRDQLIVRGFFDTMHFVRGGGGAKEFYLNKTETTEEFIVTLSHLNYKDTAAQFSLYKNEGNSSCFSLLTKAMNNQIQINGDYHPDRTPGVYGGTWVNIYLNKDESETEVTNTELRNSLLIFESLVKEKLK